MKQKQRFISFLLAWLMVATFGYAIALPQLQDDKKKTHTSTVQSVQLDEDTIPDSLLHTRWQIQRTQPYSLSDLYQSPLDLKRPDNLQYQVVYNDTLDRYIIGNRMGSTWLSAPIMLTPKEYLAWTEQQQRNSYFRKQNDEIFQAKGKEKFDFSDMHFDLGPAEKIFGPGGIRVKTQGSAELKFGINKKNIDNPSLPIRNRKTTMMDFDEKINLNVNGKVGDKVNMNLNYNTDATFDFDAQNMKLKYDGKEDEIIKLVEAGNVSFPSNSSLIKGASSLFGVRTDMQFGKLKLQMVASQKKSASKSVSTRGGVQLTPFELNVADYEENRHFFLSQYFRNHYDAWMQKLPNLTTGITINRVEVWVTNKTGNTTNTRNIVALTDLGENQKLSNPMWAASGQVPSNQANTEYAAMNSQYAAARDIDQAATTLDGGGLVGGADYEKLESARLLNSSEYTVNIALGYISLKTSLQTDQVLAVAYEYTSGGVTYQVGEFASDLSDTKQALFVKSLKNTSNNPRQGNWGLMMKNVYYLASTVEKEKFRLDVKYQSDTTGVYLSYIPEQQVKEQPIIRVLGADRLDNNNKAHSNGYFDYVEGYTISNGRVFIPKVEPFGSYMRDYLVKRGVAADKAEKYAFTELYDSTKTVAKQIAEKNKYQIAGQFKGSAANVISLDAYNVPQGSVVVTAGGITLKEGTDYSVDYSAGEVTILNQSIIDAGTAVNVSLESNTDFGQTRKTMYGLNWEYDFTKNFQLSGTIQHLSEQALTTKVSMGSEPLKNTLWGINLNWRKESQWLTNVLDKIPFLHLTQPSQISFTGEFAQLIAGEAGGTQDNASYIDDFEGTKTTIDVTTPTSWFISSVPSLNFKDDYSDKTGLSSGFHRSLLAWYTIDPLFTRRGSSLTPGHIKGDLKQLSNHYVREVYTKELFPLRDQSSYQGATNTLNILNLAYYPSEPGPYNFNVTDLQADGTLQNPQRNWGGMMRKLDTNDFEQANIEYIEFWMLDPFIYSREQADAADYGGDFYINLGEVSEDILRDGKKFYESGMPVDGSKSYTYTQWGKIPTQSTVTYAFATTSGSRALQDVGFNGLTDAEEQEFYKSAYLDQIQGKVNQAVFDSIFADPARDDYHYFRGSDWDEMRAPILQRYKYINNPQGNSPDSDSRSESYDTSYKSTPDVEDINQDYTLNEYEKYFQYRVSIRPEDLVVGNNHIVDKREYSQTWRDNTKSTVTWYQFRIPIDEFESRQGNINDFSSIRFMRMFLTGFKKPIVLRFGTFDLVMGKWRTYDQPLSAASGGTLDASSVSLEENGEKTPVNYVLPPGIRREQDPSQPQLVEANEQALSLVVKNMSTGEAKAVYKNSTLDLRQYKRIQMFVHANALEQNITRLQDGDLSVFIRLGSDYKNNYYEYEIPLKLTEPRSNYNRYVLADCKAVWPEENMLDVPLSVFTALKKNRNKAKAQGVASYLAPYSMMDAEHPQNKITIVGNPSLGEVKTMMLGVRNNSADIKSGEVWINELRLKEHNNSGGWAANANLNVQLSDLGSVNATGRYISEGFGGLEDGVASRTTDNYGTYSVTTSLEMGKFFPDKAKVSIPLYYSVTKEKTTPKYNPLDTDMELKDALDAAGSKHERDSIENIAATKITQTNFSISNARVGIATKRHPMPYDPANFSFTYSHQHQYTTGETTMYERKDNWRGALDYSWSPVYKAWEPFKGLKNKSKWLDILKRFGLNWLPQNIAFNTEMTRDYYELQERDMETLMSGAAGVDSKLPLTFSEQFLWNREFSINWDLTKNLHMNFQSATHAQIEEPYTPVNKDLYADQYHAWKDSVWTSIRHWGAPLDYSQNFQASYKVPLNLLPVFDWVNSDASYNANYSWERGTEDEEGNSYGNTINTQRELTLNGNFNLVKLYNHVPFLKKVNDKFDRTQSRAQMQRKKQEKKKKKQEAKEQAADPKKALPKNKRAFEREITLLPDTTFKIRHGKNTKRLIVNAKTEDGKVFSLKYKKVDNNQIRIISKVDTAMKVKLSVLAKEPLDDKKWYKGLQLASRLAMMVRNVSINYRSSYQLTLPGFLPSVGDAFGQKKVGQMAPGLDFAFGMVGDDYIGKARNNDWLLCNDSIATPATTSRTDNLTLRATLEPVKDFKIDLSATRTKTTQKSIQYMYEGTPTTQSGAFQMTTISLGSAFEGMGNANSGYRSKTFEKFVNSLAGFRDRVEAQYAGTVYPAGSALAGGKFDASRTPVNQYSSDVMIPAFLKAYTSMGGNSLSVFPALSRMLPNWTIRYSGLGRLPWFNEHFKSININHSYKSVFAVGSYNSYSTFQEYMNGLGFVSDATTGNPSPSSMFNISQVSINESFSPLLGMDVTFNNNMTVKAEYRQTRVLNLSMTSVQLNEALSKDWVIGMGYRINNFDVFGWGAKASRSKSKGSNKNAANKNATTTKTVQNGTNHDLNLRLDFSFRKQAAIVRDIASMVSSASSGNNALKLSFSADYTFSKLLTMSFYYDRQTNTPLLSSSSYPTTTQDFGLSIKFSLTR
ncbi:cell surface protein SprA [Prevotella copri]|uniref:T9SS outer membrane translocon Sov/SprA n=1 Tax=Segatella copri TaxID=165179 RepID=UPI0020CE726C|nr:cell surface protein SprA [Segatella copri]MCP9588906.1 cell surface protein SprA [Segatella copri]MCP9591771.1 cell surface protein SprA [Segatella copri]MCP9594696.1 cell surface protein SprA [Segatella copri]